MAIRLTNIHVGIKAMASTRQLDQQCTDAKGTSWHCGKASKRKLEILIKGKHLIYNIKGTDLYKRKLGIWQGDFKEPEEFRKGQKLKKSKKAKANNPQIKTLYKSSSKIALKKNSNNKQKTKNKYAPRKKS